MQNVTTSITLQTTGQCVTPAESTTERELFTKDNMNETEKAFSEIIYAIAKRRQAEATFTQKDQWRLVRIREKYNKMQDTLNGFIQEDTPRIDSTAMGKIEEALDFDPIS